MIELTPLRGLTHAPRRVLLLASAALLCLFLLPAVSARADTSSTLTVVGTSDVSDSGLIPNLIGPEFENAYPQFTFKYIGTASGAAVTAAENGSDSASVLIVHAPSLENQFVAGIPASPNDQSWSYQGAYGRAIWVNDFIMAGPTAPDPAGVSADASNNIVQAFEDIATEGYNGGGTPAATFVTRGNTSGTSVAEHAIWALVAAQSTQPTGLTLCTLNAAEGGGETPIDAADVGSDNAQCPSSGALPPAADVPPWYVTTGLSQGANVVFANACVSGTSTATYNQDVQSGANTCYVFTDRGTYDYLASGIDPTGATNSYYTIPNLAILTRNNSASAPGGQDELVNYFHAYIINPSAVVLGGTTDEPVNLTAAQDFVNFITSPTVQSQLANYLSKNIPGDSGGPPFVADASPGITATGIPSTVAAGSKVTVTGAVTNEEPNYPALVNDPVTVNEVIGGLEVPVGSGTTGAAGAYSATFTPPSSGSYEVTTGAISEVVNNTLNPMFGDVLSTGASAPVSVGVQSGVSISSATASTGGVTVSGALDPAALDSNAKVTILARPSSSTGAFSEIGASSVPQGQSAYAVSGTLGSGSWQIEASYSDPGEFLSSTSSVATVTIPSSPPAHTVSFSKVSAKNGKVTVTGTLKPAPTSSGAKVELLALKTTTVKVSKGKKKKTVLARVASAGLKEVAHTSVATGKTSFTIKTKLKRGYKYILQLEYVQSGQTSSYSKLSSVAVH